MVKNKLKLLLYAAVFVVSLGAGVAMSKQPEYICRFEPYIALSSTAESKIIKAKKGGIVNINTATASELTALNGIGEKLAERIVEYRTENGSFELAEDILKVPGIGEKKFAAIREYIEID